MIKVSKPKNGLFYILPSTVIAGLLGYVITILLARYLGGQYSAFAVFWASLYFIIGALSGIQQEFARLFTSRTDQNTSTQSRSALWFLIGYSLSISFIVALMSISIVVITNNSLALNFIPQLITGIFFNILLVGLAGYYYGTQSWISVAAIIIFDVLLRLIFLIAGINWGWTVDAIAWLVVAPIPITFLALYGMARRSIRTYWRLNTPRGLLVRNINLTVFGALGSSLLVSGIPILISLGNQQLSPQALSTMLFALILTRAPLIVGVLALQSFLVVKFKEANSRSLIGVVLVISVLILAGLTLVVFAYFFGSQLIAFLAGTSFYISAANVSLLTFLSIPTALLAVSGAYVLASNRHVTYAFGWSISAILAGVFLLTIPDAYLGVSLALGLAPVIGSVIHLFPIGVLKRAI